MKNKSKNYFQIKILLVIIFIFINQISAEENFIKKQSDEIAKMLRCMTCQNLSIYESDTVFSEQIKEEIYKQLKEEKSKEEIINFIVERYGEYILLKPKFNKKNLILWSLPFFLLISSFVIILVKLRKN